MTAIDTNVLVRLLTNDDPVQSPRAARVLARDDVFVSTSVLLETEWVLRGAYGLGGPAIHAAFERLVSTASIALESPAAVHQAVDWLGAGMDFADALHLASASGETFVTFDRKLAKRAARAEGAPRVELL